MPLSPALRQDDLADAYRDCHEMIYKIVHRLATSYGVPFNDLASVAHELMVKAYDRYDRSKGTALSTWIYGKVNWGLLSYLRTQHKKLHHASLDEAPEPTTSPNFFLTELRDDLTTDARLVVNLILDSQSDFHTLCKWNKVRSRNQVIQTVKECLEDRGWNARDVKDALREIRAVLNEGGTREPVAEAVEDDSTRPALERRKTTRDDIWLLARTGITPSEVRALLRP